MVDIKEQVTFNLLEEEKCIVMTNNTNFEVVKQLEEVLGDSLKEATNEPFTSVPTFGKLKAKVVYIVNFEALAKSCKRKKIYTKIAKIKEDTVVLVDTFQNDDYELIMQELSEKLLTENYEFNAYKSEKEDLSKDFYYFGETEIYNVVKTGYVYGESINKCRDLVNTPYNYLNAIDLAEYALDLEKYDQITVKIYDKKEIEAMNMGAFLGVNKGSTEEPRLIYIKYQGNTTFEDPVALVGKGVMYDTGGYSLKGPQYMPGMKVDMAGAAAVITAIEGMARLNLKSNAMAIVAATDNRIGDGAIVPDDILTAANGKTIEVISTDAEGRLTLADAVWFAQKEGAKKVIDIATLTGAMVMALGSEYTGAFTNNREFYNTFEKATKRAKENIWEMPINKGYHKELKSDVADMKNKGGRNAGASQAAAFIEKFIEKDTAWIHLDVAGTASDKKGGTGVMVKSFIELLK